MSVQNETGFIIDASKDTSVGKVFIYVLCSPMQLSGDQIEENV